MPRYFFHVDDGVESPDLDGTEFPGPDQARSEAVISCGETLRALNGKFWDSPGWEMVVKDWQGNVVCVLTVVGQTAPRAPAKL
jgi:hypothetical protein